MPSSPQAAALYTLSEIYNYGTIDFNVWMKAQTGTGFTWFATSIKNSENTTLAFLGPIYVGGGSYKIRYSDGSTTTNGTALINVFNYYKYETIYSMSTGSITFNVFDSSGILVETFTTSTTPTLKDLKYLTLNTSDILPSFVDDINVLIETPAQIGFLPNGDAPICVQWDGNVVSNNVSIPLNKSKSRRI